MAFELFNTKSTVFIGFEHEGLFQLLPNDGSGFSITRQLRQNFYGDMTISQAAVSQFRNEISQLLLLHKQKMIPFLHSKHKVHSRDPAVIKQIDAELLESDAIHVKLKEIVSLCDEAMEAAAPILCNGD